MSYIKDSVQKKIRHRLWLTMAISCFLLVVLYSFVLAPIYTSLNQNILYRGSVGMDVFYEILMILEIGDGIFTLILLISAISCVLGLWLRR